MYLQTDKIFCTKAASGCMGRQTAHNSDTHAAPVAFLKCADMVVWVGEGACLVPFCKHSIG